MHFVFYLFANQELIAVLCTGTATEVRCEPG